MVGEERVEEFRKNASALGAEVHLFATSREAFSFLSCFIQDNRIEKLMASADMLVHIDGKERFPLYFPGNIREYGRADACLVLADFGITATGTLVRLDRNDEERLTWTLPPVCVSLLACERLVPDLDSLSEVFREHLSPEKESPAQISLVSGPSRTADIEGELSLGVHGPARVLILLVEEKVP